jgi:hypothetical protein
MGGAVVPVGRLAPQSSYVAPKRLGEVLDPALVHCHFGLQQV